MLSRSAELKLWVIVLITAAAVFHVNAQNTCTTARRLKPGFCVPISTCKVITAMLKYPKDLVEAYVQESLCGNLNDVGYVCCEQGYVTPEGLSAPVPGQLNRENTRLTGFTVPAPNRDSRIRPGVPKSQQDIQNGMNILSLTRCGYRGTDRVANGDDAELQEFPWMALLVYDDGVRLTTDCGGSLITHRYVLTAAHCIRNSLPLARVRLGEHDLNTNPDCVGRNWKRKCAPPFQEIDIEEAVYHEEYSSRKFSNDIGLIRLVRNVEINSAVKPICLPITENSRNAFVPKMQITGWGHIETGLKASVLQKATVALKSNDHCRNIHKLITITDKQLCAGGDENVISCRGDSGGPLFFNVRYKLGTRYVQYGVVGSGATTCGTSYPDVYAKVLSYLQWIAGNISN